METELPQAPPVVAVVVVHDPGDWFEVTLDALAAQDYPNLRFLFLVAEPGAEARRQLAEQLDAPSDEAVRLAYEASMETRIKVRVPSSFVRPLPGRPGFGPAVNEVLRLVEGDNGFFLICQDDIAPDPDAVRMLVEEMYRSNAGIVGPKLVDWDRPSVLQSVGLGLDRFGEIEQPIEPGEVDQEQHDGVRDVFVVPSACMLVRADLFRELGGFDDAIDLLGEDVELCWRVHHGGARVVVAPLARVRHRSRLAERRPDLPIARIAARHRLRAVATLTGAPRLPLRLLELVVLTLVELVVGLFTGRFREAVASARALIGLIPRIGSIIRRRRVVAPGRRVPEREVLGLQERGSARLSAFLRSRDTTTLAGSDHAVRRWRESTSAPVIAWIVALIALVVGSRSFSTDGVPPVGDFLPLPESPRDLLGAYASGWNPTGTGAAESNPTGWAAMGIISVVTLFRMGAFQVVLTVGVVVLGLIGLWKLATVFPSTRAR
ncbi:MAG: glycosyltransferase, partial [Actinomycetota bacterium]